MRTSSRFIALRVVAGVICVTLIAACDERYAAAAATPVAATQPKGNVSAAAGRAAPLPAARAARFVKLVAVTEWSGKPFAAVAEFNLIDATGVTLDRAGWTVTASSADAADPATSAVDGKPRTHWHSKWQGTPAPLPHELVVDLKATHKLSGFRMLPRQDNVNNGSIDQYRFYISTDGTAWGEPVSAGSFMSLGAPAAEKTVIFAAQTVNHVPLAQRPPPQVTPMGTAVTLALKASDEDGDPVRWTASGLPPGMSLDPASGRIQGTPLEPGRFKVRAAAADGKGPETAVAFDWTVSAPAPLAGTAPAAPGEVRFVKLVVLSEAAGQPWTAIAEFNLLDARGQVLPHTGWVASADSVSVNDHPGNAIDGNPGSIWHTQWDGAAPPPPHSLIIDLHRYTKIGGFKYLPRQDQLKNGAIGRWRLYTSVEGSEWGKPVSEGDFSASAADPSEKTVLLR